MFRFECEKALFRSCRLRGSNETVENLSLKRSFCQRARTSLSFEHSRRSAQRIIIARHFPSLRLLNNSFICRGAFKTARKKNCTKFRARWFLFASHNQVIILNREKRRRVARGEHYEGYFMGLHRVEVVKMPIKQLDWAWLKFELWESSRLPSRMSHFRKLHWTWRAIDLDRK